MNRTRPCITSMALQRSAPGNRLQWTSLQSGSVCTWSSWAGSGSWLRPSRYVADCIVIHHASLPTPIWNLENNVSKNRSDAVLATVH